MKGLMLPLAICAVAAGCVTYGDPNYGTYYPGAGYYPGGVNRVDSNGVYAYPGAYGANVYRYDNYGGRTRDRDGDGIRNRDDIDRDGDGVPNHLDGRPNNPRRQ